ncbi:hypothetical protein HM003_08435 [Candidatus Bathyarchaeota archaeon A05DMB-5]|jgi:hypothetical protein|nr:hypothetical protein [Candidatus Bathyarchaeota archaeon A05DMB-5]
MKTEDIDPSVRKCLEGVNKDYNKALSKIAKTPIEFKKYQDGILGRFETKDGIPFVSYTDLRWFPKLYEGGLVDWFDKPGYKPIQCFCGTMANRPIPTSMFVKKVKVGLFKEKLSFLPFVPMSAFSAKEVYKEKFSWNPLIERLNQDNYLLDLIKELPTRTGVATSSKITEYFTINDEDKNYETLCQVIPLGNDTFISTRHMFGYGGERAQRWGIERAVKAISRIRELILEYGCDQPTTGQFPEQWATAIAALLTLKE